ncbi:MAG: bifunctional phosphoribosyl-AMP cyclohydrolase/phosphoribosyl-ATP diphosphatase HisIE [Culturomica sp.]|jgi:phosphoribosyl-ATP pyrophosphohydrolase/phosphoribosyl-AMP cyclohydrolase|nr:bifunctional phosphoribosyl-AMP cyclohydrolase/phosphoribosyl-ATP diphosphatase HisIE [Culturomica sp.]
MEKVKFDEKGLIPAIIQDADTRVVLMMGYMNAESLRRTEESGKVCFFSRSRQRLWTKGEESGNFLEVTGIRADCDGDTLLIRARPYGPVCHTGSDTCWREENRGSCFLFRLERLLQKRKNDAPSESYTARLLSRGINKVAQKVGEEAVELVIEAKDNDRELFLNEAADLMYHYLVLLLAKGYELEDVIAVLKGRNKA